MTTLSVVIPCYNCESTLEAAVSSVLQQAPIFPFDLTLIDDGSTDSTYQVIRRLARRDVRIKVLQHEANRGGGAARNTAILNTTGELVFCLDSDDMLGAGFLESMTRFWSQKRCDAVAMSTSIKFRGMDTKNVAYVSEYETGGRPVRFESFLDGSPCPLHVVFMMTRAAFSRVGGYPTEHGFDTQGMGFRFLCHGLSAYACPDTLYYHRVGLTKSYYKREQQAGRLNWNWLNILDEFLYLFKDSIQDQLLRHDIFDVPGRPAPNDMLKAVAGRRDIYASDYRSLLRKGPQAVARESTRARNRYRQYWLGNFHRLQGRHATALRYYARALALGFRYRMIYYRMLQAELGLAGGGKLPVGVLEELLLYSRPFPVSRRPLDQRLFHRLMANERLRQPALFVKNLRDRLRRRKFA